MPFSRVVIQYTLVFPIYCCYKIPMNSQRCQLAIRGLILIALIVLLFFFSRYIPRPFSAFATPGEDFDDFEGIYSNSDRLTKFLQSLGPYSPAVFVILQELQVIVAPFSGQVSG